MCKLSSKVFNLLVDKIQDNQNWFDEFMELVREYYKDNSCGKSLHIVLDDGNIDKDSVNWCAGYACGVRDEAGLDIANLMLMMTWQQRNKVYKARKV